MRRVACLTVLVLCMLAPAIALACRPPSADEFDPGDDVVVPPGPIPTPVLLDSTLTGYEASYSCCNPDSRIEVRLDLPPDFPFESYGVIIDAFGTGADGFPTQPLRLDSRGVAWDWAGGADTPDACYDYEVFVVLVDADGNTSEWSNTIRHLGECVHSCAVRPSAVSHAAPWLPVLVVLLVLGRPRRAAR